MFTWREILGWLFRRHFWNWSNLSKTRLSILKNVTWSFDWCRLKSYDSVSELKKKVKMLITSLISYEKHMNYTPKKLTHYAEHVNISTTTWSKVHLICRISIIVIFTKKWYSKSSMWVADVTSQLCYNC